MEVVKQLILAIVLTTSAVSYAASNVCGDKNCEKYEYCSDLICRKCSPICEETSHNYDWPTCNEYCQGYVNDFGLAYMKKKDVQDYINEYVKKDVQDLIDRAVFKYYVLALVSLFLSIFIILVIIGILLYVWVQYRRRKIVDTDKSRKKVQTVHAICNNNSTVDGVNNVNRLHLKMPSPTVDRREAPSEVTTTTPLSTRHPAEDATLEYAYDNPALTNSPTSFKESSPRPRTETSF